MEAPCELALPGGDLFDEWSLRQVVHEENAAAFLQSGALISKCLHHLVGEADRGGENDVSRGPIVLEHVAFEDLYRSA